MTDGFGYEEIAELSITKYLYYVLKNIEVVLNSMKRGAGVPHVSGEALSNIMIPLPSVEEQKRIVKILDHSTLFVMTYPQDFRQKSKHVRSSMNITGIS